MLLKSPLIRGISVLSLKDFVKLLAKSLAKAKGNERIGALVTAKVKPEIVPSSAYFALSLTGDG